MLYGALYADPSTCRPGLVWTKQIQLPLDWISTLLQEHNGDLVRPMDVDSHFRRGRKVEITTDASPYGIGGFICIDGQPVEYYAAPTTEDDANVLGVPFTHDSKCQQAFEALALLVALRLWRHHWAHVRCVVHVQSDNMAALSTICKMQTSSHALGIIAREIALDTADEIYEPQIASHVPGIANVVADTLSRRFDPAKVYSVPPPLAHAVEVQPEARTGGWWRTLVGPGKPKGDHGGRPRASEI